MKNGLRPKVSSRKTTTMRPRPIFVNRASEMRPHRPTRFLLTLRATATTLLFDHTETLSHLGRTPGYEVSLKMRFHTEQSLDRAKSFDTIGQACFASDTWFNATSKGERYRFEIYQRHGKVGYVVKVMDDVGFTVGHLAQRSEVQQQFEALASAGH